MAADVELNETGDLIVSRSDRLRALAAPGGLGLIDALQHGAPATSTELANQIGLDPAIVEKSLAGLASVGMVEQQDDRWSAPGSGLLVSIPEDADQQGVRAGRELYRTMIDKNLQRVAGWLTDDLGTLNGRQVRSSGAISASVRMTDQELEDFQLRVDELLLPYLDSRRGSESDSKANPIRMTMFIMPQPLAEADGSTVR